MIDPLAAQAPEQRTIRRRERRARKREKARIFYDILTSIVEHENGVKDGVRITYVQDDVNLPSDRLRIHLREMNKLGLVRYDKMLASTEKGRQYLVEYRRIVATLKQFGLL